MKKLAIAWGLILGSLLLFGFGVHQLTSGGPDPEGTGPVGANDGAIVGGLFLMAIAVIVFITGVACAMAESIGYRSPSQRAADAARDAALPPHVPTPEEIAVTREHWAQVEYDNQMRWAAERANDRFVEGAIIGGIAGYRAGKRRGHHNS